MTDLAVAILLLKTANRIVDWHGPEGAQQLLVEAMSMHPELPWKIAIEGLLSDDASYKWANVVLRAHTLLNDGEAA